MFNRKPVPATTTDPELDLVMDAVASVEREIVEENEKAKRNGAIKYDAHHRKINELIDERDALLNPPIAPPLEAPAIEFMEPGL